MTTSPPPEPPTSPAAENGPPRIVASEALLGGQRELLIQHGAEQYRLRLTNSNKLILVK